MKLGRNCARSTKTAYAARVWRKQQPTVIRRIMSQSVNTSGRMILLLGGARAGKSTYAMRLAQDGERASGDEIWFIATAQGLDEDMTKRIARHRAERPTHWRTIEEPYQIDEALRQASEARIVIVDCLTLFVSKDRKSVV